MPIKGEGGTATTLVKTFANEVAGTVNYPSDSGFDLRGQIGFAFQYKLTTGANNTFTITVEGTPDNTDANSWTDITFGGYDCTTGGRAASYVTPVSTTNAKKKVDFQNPMVRFIRIKVVLVTGGAASNSGSLWAFFGQPTP